MTKRQTVRAPAPHAVTAGYITAWWGAYVNYATVPLAAILLSACLLLMDVHAFASPHTPDAVSEELSRDVIFTGGITLLGLVAFGSLLNLMVSQATKPAYGKGVLIAVSLGAMSTALGAVFLILTAYFSLSELGLTFAICLVTVGVVVVVWGAIHAWIETSKNRKQDPPTD